MRKLVTYRVINKIEPILKADYIELAHVDGWQVIVRKGDYKVGDVVLYCEVDSFVPHEIAPFLTKEGKEPSEYKGIKGERVKTTKLFKTLSQGLILPASLLPRESNFPLNEDVSKELGVIKWEEPEVQEEPKTSKRSNKPTSGTAPFPEDFPKTDQERVQNLPFVYEKPIDKDDVELYRLAHDCTYEVTEKLDGTSCSIRLAKDQKHIEVFSRNKQILNEGAGTIYGYIAEKYNMRNKLRKWTLKDRIKSLFSKEGLPVRKEGFAGYVFQGEIIGPKVQGNRYGLTDLEFYVYDVYDTYTNTYLTPERVCIICKELNFKHVPVKEEEFKLENSTLDDLLNKADFESVFKPRDKSVLAEGIVLKANLSRRFSFKVISNNYLLN